MHFSTNGLRAGGLTAPRRVTAESSHPQGRGPGNRRVGAVAHHVNGAILRQQPHRHREQRQLEGPEVNSMCHRIPMDLALNTWGASWGPRPVLVQPVAKDGFYIFQKWGGKGAAASGRTRTEAVCGPQDLIISYLDPDHSLFPR